MNHLEAWSHWVAGAPPITAAPALARATDAVIDTVACILSSRHEQVVTNVARTVTAQGRCTVVGAGRCDAEAAALLNGTAAHAQDFDDYHAPSVAHVSAVLVPTALAEAEMLAAGGRRMLDAYIVGLQVMAVLGRLMNMGHYLAGWHATSTLGAVGAAAVAARLRSLTATQCGWALSLATSMASGFRCQIGSMAKPLHAGLAAQAGIRAAALAQAGVTASSTAFDGPCGALALWNAADPVAPPVPTAVDAAGLSIDVDGLVVKQYPCCGYIARLVDAAIDIAQRADFAVDRVGQVRLSVPERHLQVVQYHRPEDALQARFSYPFCIAAALAQAAVTNASFSRQNIRQPEIQQLLPRITVTGYAVDPAIPDSAAQIPDHIAVEMTDGSVIDMTVEQPLGSPGKPLTTDALLHKLFANNPCPEIAARQAPLTEQLVGLAQLDDIRQLTALLAG